MPLQDTKEIMSTGFYELMSPGCKSYIDIKLRENKWKENCGIKESKREQTEMVGSFYSDSFKVEIDELIPGWPDGDYRRDERVLDNILKRVEKTEREWLSKYIVGKAKDKPEEVDFLYKLPWQAVYPDSFDLSALRVVGEMWFSGEGNKCQK